MIRDRYLLWLIISVLGVLIVAETVGNVMMGQWRDSFSQPNPVALRILAK